MSDLAPPEQATVPNIQRCARHPDVETGLTCNRCGTPICPRCMVQTPVGSRCPDCAQLRRLPTFDVRPRDYARAAAAALAVAVALGFLWSLLPLRGGGVMLVAMAVGLAAGEAISRAANRKRSLGLKATAAAAVVLTFWMSVWFPYGDRLLAMAGGPLGLPMALEAAARLAFASLTSVWTLVGLALGAYFATTRIDR